MYNLGISCYYHDSAAAILKDGHVVAAVEEERFSRKKFDDGFPNMAIDWCLQEAGIRPEQIDSVAFYDKPVLKFDRLLDNYITVSLSTICLMQHMHFIHHHLRNVQF